MQLYSVNIGEKRPVDTGKPSIMTGIFKHPAVSPVMISREGLAGDVISNKKHHGGPDQAVYVYTLPDYAWWSEQLGRKLAPGTFGENLTLTELHSATLNIGDRLIIGNVVLEMTAPRIPCGTLARSMEDDDFVKQFHKAERPGVYCRVLQEGEVRAGDSVRLEPYAGEPVGVLEVFRDFYSPKLREEAIQRFLNAPIAIRVRAHKEKQIHKLLSEKADNGRERSG